MRYRRASFQIILACIPEFAGPKSLADGKDFMDLYLFWYDSAYAHYYTRKGCYLPWMYLVAIVDWYFLKVLEELFLSIQCFGDDTSMASCQFISHTMADAKTPKAYWAQKTHDCNT